MKRSYLLVAAAAILASSACNKEKGGESNAGTSTEEVAVKPPASGDWSEIVTATNDGGFRMGNPNAKVKLVEYGSMTCPHCREFDEVGVGPLVSKYVKPGKISYEFRNYVRDGVDMAASLITRCNGAKTFFPLTRQMFKDQPNWITTAQANLTTDKQQALGSLPSNQQTVETAKLAGLTQWAAVRGVPEAKSAQCLADQAQIDRLVQINSDATSTYDLPGTPTFLLNGKMVPETATWDKLEPALREALGG